MRSLKYFLFPLAVLTLDQLSKSLVVTLPLPHRLNPGGAFSLLASLGGYTTFTLGVFALLLTLWCGFLRRPSTSQTLKIGWGLLLGGTLSNTLDRLVRGGVLDFLQFGPWPNFNLADVAIVLGLVILVVTFVIPPAKVTGR